MRTEHSFSEVKSKYRAVMTDSAASGLRQPLGLLTFSFAQANVRVSERLLTHSLDFAQSPCPRLTWSPALGKSSVVPPQLPALLPLGNHICLEELTA